MKFFTVLAVAGAASATIIPAAMNTGSSAVSRSEDGLGNYAFGYNEDHATGGTFRKEQGGPGYMSGSYGLRDADGRMRTVNYVADALGYRASIATNEPGTDVKQDPAAADYNLGAAAALVAPAAPVAAYAAPVAAYAAPVVHAAPVAHYAAPIAQATSYSTAVNHVAAAPVVHAAPVAHYAAPVVHAPIAQATSYSTAVNHVAAAAPVAHYAAPVAAYAAPVAYAAKTYAAPAIASSITGFNSGYYAPAIAHSAYAVNAYSSPVVHAAKAVHGYAAPVVHAAKAIHY